MFKFRFVIALVLLATTVLMTGCAGTINGIGKDLQSWTADETHGQEMERLRRENDRLRRQHSYKTQY